MENRCRYTRINGARCTMPTLNGHDLCYQHQERKRLALLKPPALPDAAAPLVAFVYMDDHTSILANMNAVAEAFANRQIDFRQVTALTRLMQTCLKTLAQMPKLELRVFERDAVRDIAYDDQGTPLAVDPPPPPAPARRSKTIPTLTACAENPRRIKHIHTRQPVTTLVSDTCQNHSNIPHSFHTLTEKQEEIRTSSAIPTSAPIAANLLTRHAAQRR